MLKIIENTVMHNGYMLALHGNQAWIWHNGVWSEIPDYAARVTALIDSIPKYTPEPIVALGKDEV